MKGLKLAAAMAASMLIAGPLTAQTAPAALTAKQRAHQDLQCAALYASALGTEKNKATPDAEAVTGLTSLVAFFIGRASGADRTLDIKQSLNRQIYEEIVVDLDGITKRCQADGEKFGQDMQAAGAALQAADKSAD